MEVVINKNWNSFSVSVYLKDYRDGRTVIIGQKDGELQQFTLDPNTVMADREIEPLFKMPENMFNQFIKGIVNYASENKMKTENENLMQGKLAATERHLEDMREGFTKLLDKVISL